MIKYSRPKVTRYRVYTVISGKARVMSRPMPKEQALERAKQLSTEHKDREFFIKTGFRQRGVEEIPAEILPVFKNGVEVTPNF